MNSNCYVTKSLELHLFFGRIMKEHALFLRAGFTPADPAISQKALDYMSGFEKLLCDAVKLSDGIVGQEVLASGEVITEFTAVAERQTEHFTGIPINKEITRCTQRLSPGDGRHGDQLGRKIQTLNRTALKLLDGLIGFKEMILSRVSRGEMFTLNYPLLIEHILREAKLYRKYVEMLEREGDLPDRIRKEDECFWNQIMMEHAQFIRGLLDPCEAELMEKADGFVQLYCELLKASRDAHSRTMEVGSLDLTLQFRDFKEAGTQGIQQNQIRSIILPLLADHVLREANHYIRLLES